MVEFFARNIVTVYFLYGLSFFCMGFAILLEVQHSTTLDFARALIPLGFFGLIHGTHEWFEMFLLIHARVSNGLLPGWIFPLRVALLASSFLLLLVFATRLILRNTQRKVVLLVVQVVVILYGLGMIGIIYSQPPAERQGAIDVYTRYSLAVPGAILTCWGLFIQRQRFNLAGMKSFGLDVAIAALAFAVYGLVGQVFASQSHIFPSIYLNSEAFVRWFGFPIQVLRAAMACVAAVFIIRSLRAIQLATTRQIDALRESQMEERRRLEELRDELLHRTVRAQESERRRIARELHDETGQTLTALGMGLRGIADNITTNPKRAIQQAQQLESLATAGVQELQHLVSGLHPSQLDDLGLVAAFRWYAKDVSNRYNLNVSVTSQGYPLKLSPDVRVALFRIAQEAIYNVVKHAKASQASIQVTYSEDEILLIVEDNGLGFDVEKTLNQVSGQASWGLMGMSERAALIGGTCQIISRLGQGTRVEVRVKLPNEVGYV